jgi:hypothetical protein
VRRHHYGQRWKTPAIGAQPASTIRRTASRRANVPESA